MPDITPTAEDLSLDVTAIAVRAAEVAAHCRRTGNALSQFTDWPGTLAAVARRCVVAEAKVFEVLKANAEVALLNVQLQAEVAELRRLVATQEGGEAE